MPKPSAEDQKITDAINRGIHQALLEHKRAGVPVVSWSNGRIVLISPEDIPA